MVRIMRVVVLVIAAVLALCGVEARPPNIIFILADDLGYGDLGTYWNNNTHGRIKTPNINQMAAEGIQFQNVYAGDTVCAPSRCSLMTGLHSGHSRIRGNVNIALTPSDVTIPMVLKQANYTTQILGKWGLGDNGTTGVPNLKGFDEWFGYLDQTAAHDFYPETLFNNTETYYTGNTKGNYTVYAEDLFANLSYAWLRKNAEAENYATTPFFMYLAFTTPHAGGIGTTDETGEPVPSPFPYGNEPWPQVEQDFASMITRTDGYVGNIMALLQELGIDNDTVVFFASDNGAHDEGGHSYWFFDSSGPLRGYKRSMHDGGIRVPFIARWPGNIPAGAVNEQSIFAFWDMMPTFAEIAGVPDSVPKDIDGTSKWQTILGKTDLPNSPYLYFEFCCNLNFTTAVRVGEWKAVRWSLTGPMQLYNISADIGEQTDISSQFPEVVAQMATIMKEAHVEDPNFPSDPCLPMC